LSQKVEELSRDDKIVCICRSGIRSQKALDLLQKTGFKNLYHLKGGLLEWKKKIDPGLSLA
jgi:adenylyltransferase/sulfurtransferase